MKAKRKTHGQTYYAIFKGEVMYYRETNSTEDNANFESGNYFETTTDGHQALQLLRNAENKLCCTQCTRYANGTCTASNSNKFTCTQLRNEVLTNLYKD